MPDPSQIEPWMKIGLAVLAAVGTFLYTAQGPLKEWLAYKAKVKEAEAMKPDVARSLPASGLGDVMAASSIREGLDSIAAAIREGNAAIGARDKDRLAKAVEALEEKLEEMERVSGRR